MTSIEWINECSSAFRLMLATSWLAPDGRRPEQKEAIRRACSAGPDWDEYLCLVDRHRIPAMSWASLKCVPDLCLQENVVRELRRRSDACRMQSMLRLQLLAGVLRRFNRASIPVMPLKGPLLSIEMYGDPGLRQSKDRIDLTLYLCNHGSNHAWFRAKWLGDLARIHAAGSVDWMAALTRARQSGA